MQNSLFCALCIHPFLKTTIYHVTFLNLFFCSSASHRIRFLMLDNETPSFSAISPCKPIKPGEEKSFRGTPFSTTSWIRWCLNFSFVIDTVIFSHWKYFESVCCLLVLTFWTTAASLLVLLQQYRLENVRVMPFNVTFQIDKFWS